MPSTSMKAMIRLWGLYVFPHEHGIPAAPPEDDAPPLVRREGGLNIIRCEICEGVFTVPVKVGANPATCSPLCKAIRTKRMKLARKARGRR